MKKVYALRVIIFFLIILMGYQIYLFSGRKIVTESCSFTESSCELQNPNRGFYYIYSFMITDEVTDYEALVKDSYKKDRDTCLTMAQINLQAYREKEITEVGLANIEALFTALEGIDKQLIVRFLYDWDGENERYEPESMDIILGHMQQLEEILRRHNGIIFTLQGLLIGNWGELNGTKYLSDENIRRLAAKLADVTEESTYLAVRTPAQWRAVTQQTNPEGLLKNQLSGRLGLFNDGMLGNESDYGTYGTKRAEEAGESGCWSREEELAFQEQLCRQVPNGGEVIIDNSYNDFDNAVKDLSAMHVTYLNRNYDRNVLGKWENTIVHEEGCFDGMDGLTYMERHLGYRLFITDARLSYHRQEKYLSVDVSLKNVGFAPLYKKHQMKIYLYNKKTRQAWEYNMEGDLFELAGGNEDEKMKTLHMEIPIEENWNEEYKVYFSILDVDTGKPLFFANEQEMGEYGYLLGKVKFSFLWGE